LLTRSAAAQLRIPVFNVSATADELVLVQDYASVKDCLATDNQTMLQYGRGIRTIITIATAQGETNLTLPAIAAAATISARRNQVRIEVYGFSNPAMTTAAASVFGQELNVESYATFAAVQKQLVGLTVAPGTARSVVKLGVVPRGERAELSDATVVAWALQQITSGRNCNQARTSLPPVGSGEPKPDLTKVASTYVTMVGECSAKDPSNLQRAAAREYLYGLEVKK
jgi:hypothetical protein